MSGRGQMSYMHVRRTYAVFVESDGLQVRVKQQLFGVNVDWRLSLAFTAQVPFRIDQPPEFRP